MGLPLNIITSNTEDVNGFNGNTSNPLSKIPLDVTVITKSLIVDFGSWTTSHTTM